MKMQKILVQKISLLLLMLMGGIFTSLASEIYPDTEEKQGILISSELTVQDADLSEIGLSATGYQPYDIRQFFLSADFSYSSAYEAVLASGYIFTSFGIEPGLEARDIVFPFHFFF